MKTFSWGDNAPLASVEVKFQPGTDIRDAAHKLVYLQMSLGCPVKTIFNGTGLVATRVKTAADLVAEFYQT